MEAADDVYGNLNARERLPKHLDDLQLSNQELSPIPEPRLALRRVICIGARPDRSIDLSASIRPLIHGSIRLIEARDDSPFTSFDISEGSE